MKKKLSCGLLALTMAFTSAPVLLDGAFTIGVVDVEAGGAETYPLKLTVTGAEEGSIKIYTPTYGYVVPVGADTFDSSGNTFTFNSRSDETDYVISYTNTSGDTLFYKNVITLDTTNTNMYDSGTETFNITIDGTSDFTKHLVTYQRGATLLTKNFELVEPFNGTTARTLEMPDYIDPENEEYYIDGWHTSVLNDDGTYTQTDYVDGTTVLISKDGYVTLASTINSKSAYVYISTPEDGLSYTVDNALDKDGIIDILDNLNVFFKKNGQTLTEKPSDVTINWSCDNYDENKAGSYTFIASVDGDNDDNFSFYSECTVTVTITGAKFDTTDFGTTIIEYRGDDLVISADEIEISNSDITSADFTVGTLNETYTGADDYTVTLTGTGVYTGTIDVDVTVEQATITAEDIEVSMIAESTSDVESKLPETVTVKNSEGETFDVLVAWDTPNVDINDSTLYTSTGTIIATSNYDDGSGSDVTVNATITAYTIDGLGDSLENDFTVDNVDVDVEVSATESSGSTGENSVNVTITLDVKDEDTTTETIVLSLNNIDVDNVLDFVDKVSVEIETADKDAFDGDNVDGEVESSLISFTIDANDPTYQVPTITLQFDVTSNGTRNYYLGEFDSNGAFESKHDSTVTKTKGASITRNINGLISNAILSNVSTVSATVTPADDLCVGIYSTDYTDTSDDDYYSGSSSTTTTNKTATNATITVPTTVTVTTADTSSSILSSAYAQARTGISGYTATSSPISSFNLKNFPGTSYSYPITLTNTSYSRVSVVQFSDDGTYIATHGPFTVTNGVFTLTGLTQFSNFYVYGLTATSSGSSSSSGSSYSSAVYYDSGSVRVNGSYITELRNVLVGELVNLSKITTVNGQEVLGWYYDSAMTNEISNTSQFVITSSVIADGIYAKTTGTTVVPDSYVDGSTNAGNGTTTAPESTYVPSVVPSTVAKLLSKLF